MIDNSGYFPRLVAASAKLLAPNTGQYIFISSISAYADNSAENQDETAKLATTSDPTVEKVTDQTFGPLKVLCEKAAEAALPGRTTIVRPGYIVGPDDPSGRFTYWPVRIDRGGEVLVPGAPADPVQIIDVRDLGAWLITLIEQGTMGTFNATGPKDRLAWGDLIQSCRKATKSGHTLTWVPGDWIHKQAEEVFPIWAPYLADTRGFHTWRNTRAVKAGLKFRPYGDTVADTLHWYQEPERTKQACRTGGGQGVAAFGRLEAEPLAHAQQPGRVAPINLLQYCIRKGQSVNIPPALRRDRRGCVREVLVLGLQKPEVDFVERVSEELLRECRIVGRRIGAEYHAVLKAIDELARRPRLPAQFADTRRDIDMHIRMRRQAFGYIRQILRVGGVQATNCVFGCRRMTFRRASCNSRLPGKSFP